ncbi:MAG: M56 family metallopeptidase, partial [Chitinophagaceae bacterium]
IILNIFITGILYLFIVGRQNIFKKQHIHANWIFGILVFSLIQFMISALGINVFSFNELNLLGFKNSTIGSYFLVVISIIYISFLIPQLARFLKALISTSQYGNFKNEKHFAHLKLFIKQSSEILGITKNIKLIVTKYSNQAFTFGIFKPVIVLPFSIITQLNQQQIEAIILHELSHIKQNDYFKNYWIQIIKSILYFNPFIHYLSQDFILSCEKNADRTVTDFEYNKKSYADALLLLAQSENNILTLNASKQQPQLLQRIKVIFKDPSFQKKPVLKPVMILASASLLMFSLLQVPLNIPVSNATYSFNKSIVAEDLFPSAQLIPVINFENTIPAVAAHTVELSIKNNTEVERNQKKTIKKETVHFVSPVIVLEIEEKPKDNKDFHFISESKNNSNTPEKIDQSISLAQQVIFELYWSNLEKALAESVTSNDKEIIKDQLHAKLEDQANRLKEKALLHPEAINWNEFRLNLLQSLYNLNIDNAYNNSLLALVKINHQLENEGIATSDSSSVLLAQKQELKEFIQKVDSIKNNKIKSL